MINHNYVRDTFLRYFQSKGHKIVDSSSIIPIGDKSLLFVNSGMVQFKDVFTGVETRDYLRATTAQKSVRAGGKHNDLDNVGYTNRHHTFFEMLGNFSFGDYFKEEAIKYAWDLLTNDFKIDKSRLYVTVYHDDDEALNLWKKIAGLSDNKIVKIATQDNFWSMGDTGPCGPCSEIFYDLGENVKIRGGNMSGGIGENDRFIEIWNLVFMQFEKNYNDPLKPLAKKSIDTGASVERLLAILEGKTDTYETSIFLELINNIKNIYGNSKNEIAYRVIADHIRCISFLISDGILPDREGRGYVLRRIIRRAIRYANELNQSENLLHKTIPSVVDIMGSVYPQLIKDQKLIEETIQKEEETFNQTLSKGLNILNTFITETSSKTLDGAVAFKLYDTYGFPLDLTQDILRQREIDIDIEGFNAAMKSQQELSQKSWKGSYSNDDIWSEIQKTLPKIDLLYYDHLTQCSAKIIHIVDKWVILDKTVFYPEGGGQIGDKGTINNVSVLNTNKFGEIVAMEVTENKFKVGDQVECVSFRQSSPKNHTATHLLHSALINRLGGHVKQNGSYVGEDYLTFDFTHQGKIENNILDALENDVNEAITNNLLVSATVYPKKEAEKLGAIAIFDEKYGDFVRVVAVDDDISLAFCGGTHVRNTGEIGKFKILSESGISAGVRRIKAITGNVLVNCYENIDQLQEKISQKETIIAKNEKNLEEKDYELLLKMNGNNIVVKNFNNNAISRFCTYFARNNANVIRVDNICESEGKVYIRIQKSKDFDVDCKELLNNALRDKINAKGGGTKDFASGFYNL